MKNDNTPQLGLMDLAGAYGKFPRFDIEEWQKQMLAAFSESLRERLEQSSSVNSVNLVKKFCEQAEQNSAAKIIQKLREQAEQHPQKSLQSLIERLRPPPIDMYFELTKNINTSDVIDISANKTTVSKAVGGVSVPVGKSEPPIELIRADDYEALAAALARLNGLKSAESDKVKAKKAKRAEMIKKYEASGMNKNSFVAAYASSFGYADETARSYLQSGNLLKFKKDNPNLF